MTRHRTIALFAALLASGAATAALAAGTSVTAPAAADRTAAALVAKLTREEKFGLIKSAMPIMMRDRPADVVIGAGYTPGVPRLGIPSLRMTDASLGVANLMNLRRDDVATALPSTLALGSSWDPELARRAGAMIGHQARAKRFNVMLAGGVNLIREPRNGRAFEYVSEDPLLAGTIAGAQIAGIESAGIVSTVKHFALNDQETGRNVVDVRIDEAPAQESDLLAFKLAIEHGNPGSVMTSYNRVNGDYASENKWLLTDVLKRDWGYRGWVMSDWGNVHSAAKAALAGLDQQSGYQVDKKPWFAQPLMDAVAAGEVPMARIDDMATRILRSSAAAGLMGREDRATPIDYDADAQVALAAAKAGIVLLKNERGVLPLAASAKRILVVGGHADVGVLSGGGSTQVRPVGGPALELKPDTAGPASAFAKVTYTKSPPLAALRARYPQAEVSFLDGSDPAAAAQAARAADVVLVFAEQWRSEAEDVPDLNLPGGQDALIDAVAGANPRTVVVLQTGGAVLMPWLARVPAVVEAWFPGQRGGDAIAAVLSGDAEPEGRLPISFPASLDQLPRPALDGLAESRRAASGKQVYGLVTDTNAFSVNYNIEGADVGYKWDVRKGLRPLFPFGHGLTYTRFKMDALTAAPAGNALTARVRVTNVGSRPGVAVPQFYATVTVRGAPTQRLIGWQRVRLAPGESRTVSITADPRLLAGFDPASRGWRIAPGAVRVAAGENALDLPLIAEVRLKGARLRP